MVKKLDEWILISWIFVIGGIFGFIYEEIFYRIDLGMWIKRGSTFGPWVPIYGIGALLIILTTRKVYKRPLLVFLISMLVSGLLEYFTGFILYYIFDLRLWDYNVEKWNYLNFQGFVCLRSVLFFGLSALFLQYVIYPLCKKILNKIRSKIIKVITLIPALVFILDILIYFIMHFI